MLLVSEPVSVYTKNLLITSKNLFKIDFEVSFEAQGMLASFSSANNYYIHKES